MAGLRSGPAPNAPKRRAAHPRRGIRVRSERIVRPIRSSVGKPGARGDTRRVTPGGPPLRILLADDHDLLRDALVAFLEAEGDISVVTASDLGGALDRVADGPPFDLVLLDLNMPGMNGLDGLSRALGMGLRTALVSGNAAPETAREALARGAAGYVPKTLPARSLVRAVRFMASGETYVPVGLLQDPVPAAPPPGPFAELTPRERDVLRALAAGKSNKEIARDLDLAEPTIKLHLRTLFRKIGAANRTQAALIARDAGFA